MNPTSMVRLFMVLESGYSLTVWLGDPQSCLDDAKALTCEPNVRYASVALGTNRVVVKEQYKWTEVA